MLPKLWERFLNSVPIFLLATLIEWCLAFPAGIRAAVRRGSSFDRGSTLLSYALISFPSFFLAYLVIAGLVETFDVPVIGMRTFGMEGAQLWYRSMDRLWHLAIPSLLAALTGVAVMSRYVRSQMLEVIAQDYVRTARAKGLPEEQVIYKPRAPQRAAPVRHDVRPDAARADRRLGDHRADLRLARPRAARLRRDPLARLSGDPDLEPLRRGADARRDASSRTCFTRWSTRGSGCAERGGCGPGAGRPRLAQRPRRGVARLPPRPARLRGALRAGRAGARRARGKAAHRVVGGLRPCRWCGCPTSCCRPSPRRARAHPRRGPPGLRRLPARHRRARPRRVRAHAAGLLRVALDRLRRGRHLGGDRRSRSAGWRATTAAPSTRC